MVAIAFDARDSRLIRRLVESIPKVAAKLGQADAWIWMGVGEPGEARSYLRLQCRDLLQWPGETDKFRIAMHFFDGTLTQGELHNHRYPIAVLPLGGSGNGPLYRMPWAHRRNGATIAEGVHDVFPGKPYAIHDCLEIWHAVQSRRPHRSLTLADVSQPAARENRLQIEVMQEDEELREKRVKAAEGLGDSAGARLAPG